MSYINTLSENVKKVCPAKTIGDLCQLDVIIEALEVNASYAMISTFEKMAMNKDKPKMVLENDVFALDLLSLGTAHL